MREILKKFFPSAAPAATPDLGDANEQHKLAIATCALFVELAKIDGEFSEDEMKTILSHLKSHFGVTEEEAAAITQDATEALEQSHDLWTFTNHINQSYTREEKVEILVMLWKLVHADGVNDPSGHEEHLTRKLSTLLGLHHDDFIASKLRAKRAP